MMTSICAHGSTHGSSMMSPSGFVVNSSGQPNSSSLLSAFTISKNANDSKTVPQGVINSSNSYPSANTAIRRREPRAPVERPQRPLSAYNLFFRRERARMIQSTAESVKPASYGKKKKKVRGRRGSPSGKVGFAEMARTVAERWKRIDPQEKQVFEHMANIERARYFKAIEEWKTALHNEAYEEDEDDSPGEVQTQSIPNMMIHGIPPREDEESKSEVGGSHLQTTSFGVSAGNLVFQANPCNSNMSFKDSSYHVPEEAQFSSMRVPPQEVSSGSNNPVILFSHPTVRQTTKPPPSFVLSPLEDNVGQGTSEVGLSNNYMPHHAHKTKDCSVMSHHWVGKANTCHVNPAACSPLVSVNIAPTFNQSTKMETSISSEQPVAHECPELISDLALMLGDDGIDFFVNLFR